MRLSHLFAAVFLLFLFLGCVEQAYENRFKGFSTSHPFGWSVSENEMGIIFRPPDDQSAQLTVFVFYSDSNVSMKELANGLKWQFVMSLTGVSILNESQREFTVANQPALEQTMKIKHDLDGNGSYLFTHAAFFHTDSRYFMVVLTYSTEDENGSGLAPYEEAFSKALGNFRIISP